MTLIRESGGDVVLAADVTEEAYGIAVTWSPRAGSRSNGPRGPTPVCTLRTCRWAGWAPRTVAAAVGYLAGFVTGQWISVNGGHTMG